MTGPSAAFQLEFIDKLQRLLDSGSFVATYKYALLIALCNAAAEHGTDDDREQRVPIRDLGEQFLRLYWNHTRTYPGLDGPLRQNTGRPAAILATVEKARTSVSNPDHADAPGSVAERYVREAVTRVKTMPLWKLQTIGTGEHTVDDFLYPTREVDGCIALRPGVSACLRRFRPLIVSITEAAWSDFVRRTNPELGAGHDLERFLFGTDRAALHHLADPLLELQSGRCFYSGRPLTVEQAHVDHFVPWSKYPLNSPFNLVVASSAVNLQKSDHLAALPHLERWRRRLHTHRDDLLSLGANANDLDRSVEVARFAYGQAQRLQSLGWLQGREMAQITGWREILAA